MVNLECLSKPELIELIEAYDKYIQEANDDNRYAGGDFQPVCIDEFYDNDLEFYKS